MVEDPLVVLVSILGLFMGGLTFYVVRQDKSIDSAHSRIDGMNDSVAKRVDIVELKNDMFRKIEEESNTMKNIFDLKLQLLENRND